MKRESVLAAWLRNPDEVRHLELQAVVDALEAEDPAFFATHPTESGDPPTAWEKIEIVANSLNLARTSSSGRRTNHDCAESLHGPRENCSRWPLSRSDRHRAWSKSSLPRSRWRDTVLIHLNPRVGDPHTVGWERLRYRETKVATWEEILAEVERIHRSTAGPITSDDV